MNSLVAAIRLAAMTVVLLVGVFLSLFIGLMSRNVFCWILSRWYRTMLWLVGIRVLVDGSVPAQTSLVVANHISWSDVLVIGSQMPMVFLAMKEVSRWPVIGWLAARGGTLFIERGKGAPLAIEQVAETLSEQRGVVIFPEGRTTNGLSVVRFHPRIFEAAIRANVPITPIGLVYRDIGAPESSASRVSFAESGSFISSLWATISGARIDAEMKILPLISDSRDRNTLCKAAFRSISDHVAITLGSSKL